jgi:hypothetical protein
MPDSNAPEAPPASPTAATPEAKPAAAAPPSTPAAPTAAAPPASTAPAATAVAIEEAPPKVKSKTRTQRACDEKDAKGKLCCGHLKRWYDYPKEIEALVGAKAEIYRCEFCKTLYKPDKSAPPHSYTLRY